MEIEAKFATTAPVTAKQINALSIPGFTLTDSGVEPHSDVLLDTDSRLITTTMHALRIRTAGEKRVVTFKGPNQGSQGTHEREEIEAPLDGQVSFDPAQWPSEVGVPVLALTHGDALHPLLRLRVERHTWVVRKHGHVVGELALDNGEILAGGRREPLAELELELKESGTRADLETVSAALKEALPIQPEPRSKLQRGLALLRHARWTLDGYTTAEAVVRHVIRGRLRSLSQAQHGVIEQGDADSIHDMRVATRRIRSTLQAIEGVGIFPDKTLRSLRSRLSKLADELGAVRDLDIFLGHVGDWVGSDSERERDLQRLRDDLAAQRRASYEALVALIGKKKYAKLLADLAAFVAPPKTPPADGSCALTRHVVGTVLWPRYESVLRYETVIADAEPATLHLLRISCKRLRYVLEIFATVLGKHAAPLRKALVAAQSHLGDIQDLTIAIRLVEQRIKSEPEHASLPLFAEDLRKQREELIGQLDSIWQPLRAQSTRKALCDGLAAL